MEQQQFLEVIDRDEAQRRFEAALRMEPVGTEIVSLDSALGRVLAIDVVAAVDVPSFDRSNVDGFAVRASGTFDAREEAPRRLRLAEEAVTTGEAPGATIEDGWAMSIATGGMLPRGADAVVMVEYADVEGRELLVRRAVSSGGNVSFAGTDIAAGETVLRRGERLTSRETGVLAAIGVDRVTVWQRPRIAILSTGDELIAPGQPMRPGMVFDSNARILADAVRELGGEPVSFGIVRDELEQLGARVAEALTTCDAVLLSGGTSKGAGDLSYRVVSRLIDPGIVAHGVALKPGKPICLAASGGKPVVILPGFPTSAIFTFHEFVAPVLRRMAGRADETPGTATARLAVRVNSEVGRTEFLLVGLVADSQRESDWVAYPMGKGSGSVTTFSRADGFVVIGRHEEIVEAGQVVRVHRLGCALRPADLVVIGSHCIGLDYLLGCLQDRGWHTKFLAVGSQGGLEAAKRGECDVAGIHLLDRTSGQYNRPWLTPGLVLIEGYRRVQGIVFRGDDRRFAGQDLNAIRAVVTSDPACVMVNRNLGSGTRILIDQLLDGARPPGYSVQPRNHNAVAAAIVQRRADWGVTVQYVAQLAGLGFLPIADERYDFVVPSARRSRPVVQALAQLLAESEVRAALHAMGLRGEVAT